MFYLKLAELIFFLFILGFCSINYFTFYSSFYEKKWILKWLYFENFGLTEPKYWSYIITLIILFYFFFKIWASFYTYPKYPKVLEFYRRLIEINEVSFLMDLIDRYHKKDIINYVHSAEDYTETDNRRDFEFDEKQKQ